jgi:hypothetical protein
MPDVDSPPPFEAYTGDQPCIFVSYAHKDGAVVFPEITRLHEQGYRIWYDEGIDPGNEWPEEVANALADAACFVVFISPNAVESRNVRNEISFALNNKKPFLAIHVEPTQLPPGLELRMGDIQAVLKFRMTEEGYARKLSSVLPEMCIEQDRAVEIAECLKEVVEHNGSYTVGDTQVFLSCNGKALVAQRQRKPVGCWVIDDHGPALSVVADALIRINRSINPWRPVSELVVQRDADKPSRATGQWWDVTSGYGPRPDVDIECVECGFTSDFTPEDHEPPPPRCPRCGRG